jgi:uncharacterized protein with PIN domain
MQAQIMTGWHDWAEEADAALRSWRREHPHASFAEIEAAVEEQLTRVRARALAGVLAEPARAPDPLRCAECGQPLESRGHHARAVTVRGDRVVHLRRPYAVCPACGAGLFPPG